MEFEKNVPTTAEDIARAEIPHKVVQPLGNNIEADLTTAPRISDLETKRGFGFETESTAAAAQQTSTSTSSRHRTAITLSVLTVCAFMAVVVFVAIQ